MSAPPDTSPGQVVFASLLAVAGVAVAARSVSYGLVIDARMGPGAATFMAGMVLAAAGAWVAVTNLLALRRAAQPARSVSEPVASAATGSPAGATGPEGEPAGRTSTAPAGDGEAPPGQIAGVAELPAAVEVEDSVLAEVTPDRWAAARSVGLLGLLAAMLAASYVIGLLWAAVGFVFVVAAVIERAPLYKAALLAGIAGFGIWMIFSQLLNVPL